MRTSDTSKQGTVVMEFALLISLLLVPLLAGIWDVSKMIDMNQILTRAAREGVVLASRGNDAVAPVKAYVASAGLATENLSVTVQFGPENAEFGQEVIVTLNYQFADSTVYPWDELLPEGLNSVAYAMME